MFSKISFPKTFSRKRAFTSTLIAVLAIVFISGIAAVLIASSAQQRALLSSFESRKVANHFANSVSFLNASFRDALLDYEFASTGCGGSGAPNFEDLSDGYLSAAARELNSSGVYTSYSNLVTQTSEPDEVMPGFDEAVGTNATFDLFDNYGSARKNESVFLEQRIDVNNTGAGEWTANVSGFEITVTC